MVLAWRGGDMQNKHDETGAAGDGAVGARTASNGPGSNEKGRSWLMALCLLLCVHEQPEKCDSHAYGHRNGGCLPRRGWVERPHD